MCSEQVPTWPTAICVQVPVFDTSSSPDSRIAPIAMADNPVWKACKPFATGSLAGMFATCFQAAEDTNRTVDEWV